ncbi:MAG: rhodanese-like domain-containing protein [Gemmataceae bacterium]|nr:rhodanese-like domain-containing protein [Gemmataceae bacterium]
MTRTTVSASELSELLRAGKRVDIIDVRTPMEFREVHLERARNVPLDELDPAKIMQSRGGSADDPVYVICRSGGRGQKACDRFRQAGFANVINIEGGTMACVASGLPVVRGQKAMSLERQVRIAAGTLVLAGVALGWFVHPYLYGLSAFVGAGLVFAGITDTCGMGLMLAKAPWNRVEESKPAAPAGGCCVAKEVSI